MAKRSCKNVPYTLMKQQERLNVYNATSDMLSKEIDKNIQKICTQDIATSYVKTHKVYGGALHECSSLSVFGTAYKKGQYLVLPYSTNDYPRFGKIVQLLCDQKHAYFIYKEQIASYCKLTDVFFVREQEKFDLISQKHLADYRLESI